MIHLGLIGFPVEHSLSGKIHLAALRSSGLDGDYSLFSIRSGDVCGLRELLDRVRSGAMTGLNVTIPHKQNIISLLDELSPMARAIGAVNTIYAEEDKLIGHNTDAQGFLSALKQSRDYPRFPGGSTALVLGAGGAARAIVYALTQERWSVTVAARRVDEACELARQFESISTIDLNAKASDLPDVHLIVNTTPVGMFPEVDRSPWPHQWPLPRHAAIYDLVYNPRETKLARDARAQGLSATTGLGMLVEQAALAYEIWTGCQIQRDILLSAVETK